ncbi:hypothetical protein C8R46DRAFT_1042178 [Mycena filopes]|nr:hypothetical protein C8R46DRAFT_1042178 [Mycena filopes]
MSPEAGSDRPPAPGIRQSVLRILELVSLPRRWQGWIRVSKEHLILVDPVRVLPLAQLYEADIQNTRTRQGQNVSHNQYKDRPRVPDLDREDISGKRPSQEPRGPLNATKMQAQSIQLSLRLRKRLRVPPRGVQYFGGYSPHGAHLCSSRPREPLASLHITNAFEGIVSLPATRGRLPAERRSFIDYPVTGAGKGRVCAASIMSWLSLTSCSSLS